MFYAVDCVGCAGVNSFHFDCLFDLNLIKIIFESFFQRPLILITSFYVNY